MDNKTYYRVETLHYRRGSIHQASKMAELTGKPSFIFKLVSVATVTDKTMTLTQCVDEEALP